MSEVDLDDMSTDATQKQMNDNFIVNGTIYEIL